ncbi:MAG: hypothetical protein LBL90_02610 [Prevotellaceae bacterium]|jgi:hypothetical protein|nr:hypothetical protein [Prevotellaceae bacterium]
MKQVMPVLLIILLSCSAAFSQKSDTNSLWVSTSIGGFSNGFGINIGIDYEFKNKQNSGRFSMDFNTDAYQLGDIDGYLN